MWACALERGDSSELPHPYRRSPGYGSGFSSKTSHIFALLGGTSTQEHFLSLQAVSRN